MLLLLQEIMKKENQRFFIMWKEPSYCFVEMYSLFLLCIHSHFVLDCQISPVSFQMLNVDAGRGL